MSLPNLTSLVARRRAQKQENFNHSDSTSPASLGDEAKPNGAAHLVIKSSTRKRFYWSISCSLLYLVSVIFLVLTITGNTSTHQPVIRSTHFFRLDLSRIIPSSTSGSVEFSNSLARSLGLYDYYTVGLWNFCGGYDQQGLQYCSPSTTLYWFDPVSILLSEILDGATIALPTGVNDVLNLIRVVSHLIFGFLLTAACMNFLNLFLSPLVLFSRWISLPATIWTFATALITLAGTILATVMFIVFRNVVVSQEALNIGASIGAQMFAFMWLAAACSLAGFCAHAGLGCCCDSRRDVRQGRKAGCTCCPGRRRMKT